MRGKKRAEEWMHFTKASSLILSSFWFAVRFLNLTTTDIYHFFKPIYENHPKGKQH